MKWWVYLLFLLALCGSLILHTHIKKYEFINNKYFKITVITICLIIFLIFIKNIFKY